MTMDAPGILAEYPDIFAVFIILILTGEVLSFVLFGQNETSQLFASISVFSVPVSQDFSHSE